jgi:hypothetical protein
VYCGYG